MEKNQVILCPNPYKDLGLAVTKRCAGLLREAGFRVLVSPEVLDGDPETGDIKQSGLPEPTALDEETLSGTALVVSLGGDGTIMHTARRLIGYQIPLIGVNLGTVGFLAELDAGDLNLLVQAARGSYTPSLRMMLHVEVLRRGERCFSDYALNDAVIHGVNQMIRVTAEGDGRRIVSCIGDGLVVATPTGSAAYTMTAGGPLLEPGSENLILTPICPRGLGVKSFVLSPHTEVSVVVDNIRKREALLSVDGGRFDLLDGDLIQVRKAKHRTVLAHVGCKNFYDIVYEKLGEKV